MAGAAVMKKSCGHSDCSISTGIDESLTFGRGRLDDYGFWQIPCGICAQAWEEAHPEDGPCWPFKQKEREKQ
jgi:hypothetical protein